MHPDISVMEMTKRGTNQQEMKGKAPEISKQPCGKSKIKNVNANESIIVTDTHSPGGNENLAPLFLESRDVLLLEDSNTQSSQFLR